MSFIPKFELAYLFKQFFSEYATQFQKYFFSSLYKLYVSNLNFENPTRNCVAFSLLALRTVGLTAWRFLYRGLWQVADMSTALISWYESESKVFLALCFKRDDTLNKTQCKEKSWKSGYNDTNEFNQYSNKYCKLLI